MKPIALGIYLDNEPNRLSLTLDLLRRHTPAEAEIILLPDGPDGAMHEVLSDYSDLRLLASEQPQGVAACFNRLVHASDAAVYGVLEAGTLVGPGWLDQLLAALDADPRHGLAGPSTNRMWNEQQAFPRAGAALAEIQTTAALALQRFGPTYQTLAPLYSLGDFCYMVRREVIAAIGMADEGYGLGPCWEMDYNIRAARAGWHGVWARAAYAYRLPLSQRRQRNEAQLFEASKRRYQDRYCGRRLRGEYGPYRDHCRGAACPNFAPPALVNTPQPTSVLSPPAAPSPPLPQANLPLISCIMPTRNRARFVLQAISYFQRQTYPQLELLIIDDGDDQLETRLPHDPRIRYLRVAPGTSIGAKRNLACDHARGTIIAQWDDDDWYGPERLAVQVEPLLRGQATITGFTTGVIAEFDRWAFWQISPELHRRMFVEDVHGGTLLFFRRLWQQGARYPDRSLAEDAAFLRQVLRQGGQLRRIAADSHFIYMRHGQSSWGFACGTFLDPYGWRRAAEPAYLAADRHFYRAETAALPLVSCIMPTYNRRQFVPLAIAYFQRQSYARRELIIVDDGSDPVADLIPPDPMIRYLPLKQRQTIGAKRNLACQQAQGTIIAHWDDDDWHAPQRLTYQVEALLASQAELCGLTRLWFYQPALARAWQYQYQQNRSWLGGSSLCYYRRYWQQQLFAAIDIGEDGRFVAAARPQQLLVLPDSGFHIGLIHAANISPKRTEGAAWQPLPLTTITRLLGDDLANYQPLTQPLNATVITELINST